MNLLIAAFFGSAFLIFTIILGADIISRIFGDD